MTRTEELENELIRLKSLIEAAPVITLMGSNKGRPKIVFCDLLLYDSNKGTTFRLVPEGDIYYE